MVVQLKHRVWPKIQYRHRQTCSVHGQNVGIVAVGLAARIEAPFTILRVIVKLAGVIREYMLPHVKAGFGKFHVRSLPRVGVGVDGMEEEWEEESEVKDGECGSDCDPARTRSECYD